MKIALITIGDELLSGHTLERNAQWFGKFLTSKGLKLNRVTTVPDNLDKISQTCREHLETYDVIVTTGGLGPTQDDLTKLALSQGFHKNLIKSPKALEVVTRQYENYGKDWQQQYQKNPEQNYEYIPEDFEPIYNPVGLAPGLMYTQQNRHLIACPGVPREFTAMMEEIIFPKLANSYQLAKSSVKQIIIRTRETPEEKIFYSLDTDLWEQLETFGKVASLPHLLGVDIIITPKANLDYDKTLNEITKITQNSPLHEHIWQIGEKSLEEYIVHCAKEKNITFAFAESCTGGLLANLITNVPGSSAVFYGSVVSYDNSVKQNQLGVSLESLKQYGAVSKQVVQEMAQGCCHKLNVDIAIATSGIAGPSGGTAEKPVGLVAIGSCHRGSKASAQLIQYKNTSRQVLKERFTRKALFTLLDAIHTN